MLKNFFYLILLFMTVVISAGELPDTLYMKSGDKIPGSMISISGGVIKFKPYYSNANIDVIKNRVKAFYTRKVFKISGKNLEKIGIVFMDKNGDNIFVLIGTGARIYVASIDDIYSLSDIPRQFVDKINGKLSFGYNLTSANKQSQFSFDGSGKYLSKRWLLTTNLSSLFSIADDKHQSRNEFDTRYNHTISDNWFTSFGLNLFSSDVQKIKLRTNTSFGMGLTFIKTSDLFFLGSMGGTWNNEKYENESLPIGNSLDSYVELKFHYIKNKIWQLDVGTSVSKSWRDKFRTRINLNVDLTFYFTEDPPFIIGFSFKNNFDSVPQPGATKNDYVLQTNFGITL